MRSVTVEAEVDVSDVLESIPDDELEGYGLQRISAPEGLTTQLNLLAEAVQAGKAQRRDELIDQICWKYAGRMAISPEGLTS